MKSFTVGMLCLSILLIKLTNSTPISSNQYEEIFEHNLPVLTENLFRVFQKTQNHQPQIIRSGQINLNSHSNLPENVYSITSRLINSVKKSVSFLTSLYDDNVNFGSYEQPVHVGSIEDDKFNQKIYQNGYPVEDINPDVKNIGFVSSLTLPDENLAHIFNTHSEDTSNLEVTENINQEMDKANSIFLPDSNIKLFLSSQQSLPFENFSTLGFNSERNFPSTKNSLNIFVSPELQLPFKTAQNFNLNPIKSDTQLKNQNRNNIIFGKHNLFQESSADLKTKFGINRVNSKTNKNNFSSLGEIPLEDSPVFDLHKMDLINSYGRKITKFRRQSNDFH